MVTGLRIGLTPVITGVPAVGAVCVYRRRAQPLLTCESSVILDVVTKDTVSRGVWDSVPTVGGG